jgi:hypothetical protein
MSVVSVALAGGTAVLGIALLAKPIERGVANLGRARRKAWWRRRRAQEQRAYRRQRSRRAGPPDQKSEQPNLAS